MLEPHPCLSMSERGCTCTHHDCICAADAHSSLFCFHEKWRSVKNTSLQTNRRSPIYFFPFSFGEGGGGSSAPPICITTSLSVSLKETSTCSASSNEASTCSVRFNPVQTMPESQNYVLKSDQSHHSGQVSMGSSGAKATKQTLEQLKEAKSDQVTLSNCAISAKKNRPDAMSAPQNFSKGAQTAPTLWFE